MSNTTNITADLTRFNRDLADYQRMSKMVWPEVLMKQGAKFAFTLTKLLRTISPTKGKITAERLAAINAGLGIKVRQSAKDWVLRKYNVQTNLKTRRQMGTRTLRRSTDVFFGKNLWHLMINRELAMRESSRGFTSVAARFKQLAQMQAQTNKEAYGDQRYSMSRYGKAIGAAGMKLSGTRLEFDWGKSVSNPIARNAAKSLSKSRPTAFISKALRTTSADMRVYIERKLAELSVKSNLANG